MQTECFRVKVRPESLALVREWARHLNDRHEEINSLLRNEGMAIESVFLDSQDGVHYLIYYLRATDLDKTRKVSRASAHPIDVFHRDMMKKIGESSVQLECLVDFSTIDPT